MQLLLDADAFLCLRKISLLKCLVGSQKINLVMTSYVARHELNAVKPDIDSLVQAAKLTIAGVKLGTSEFRQYRVFQRTHDKGEAEAIAWAVTHRSPELFFVSQDAGALRLAKNENIPHGNVARLGVELARWGIVSEAKVSTLFAPCYQNLNACGHGCPGSL
ncbi:MAG: hypothetical protein HQL87_04155 [Magnetococcales bacterium]|nr:hypothetical protein [Magnetococcales bacterium]